MHQEELVLIGVRAPDELALHFGELHILAVGDGDDARREIFGDGGEFFLEMTDHAGSSFASD